MKNRIASAWVKKVAVPSACPICGHSVGGGQNPPRHEKIPLLVHRTGPGGELLEVILHVGCQVMCTPEEAAEIGHRRQILFQNNQ